MFDNLVIGAVIVVALASVLAAFWIVGFRQGAGVKRDIEQFPLPAPPMPDASAAEGFTA